MLKRTEVFIVRYNGGIAMNYIFIDSDGKNTKVGTVEDDILTEFYSEEINNESLYGNIYRGRVENVLKGMECAFVDIGEEKNGFLKLKDALPKENMYKGEHYKVEDIIKGGEEVIVQVVKEASETKGAKITTHISLPGRYLVLTPYSNQINVSKKIIEDNRRNRLKKIGKRIIHDDIGIIFRTVSEKADESILKDEYNALVDIYLKIESQRNFLPTPKLLYKDLDLVYQIVRDRFNDRYNKIIVNNKEIYNNLLLLDDYFTEKLKEKIELDLDFSVEYNTRIQTGIKEALNRKVSLKSGGYIVIDETEALTAIDVNTGNYIGSYSLRETVLKTNLEAAEEIARQIKLRDIGGIIIVDFIDMKDEDHTSKVLSQLSKEFLKDRNKPSVIDVTKLSLVEITRRKTKPTLDSQVTETCPRCNGAGRIRTKG